VIDGVGMEQVFVVMIFTYGEGIAIETVKGSFGLVLYYLQVWEYMISISPSPVAL